MSDFLYSLRSQIRQKIGQYPPLFYSTYGMKALNRHLAVHPDTELVIEGFPRSANTYSVVAFEQIQPVEVKIAHHLHVPCQILKAIEYQIPVILLIRNPQDVTVSFLIRNPDMTIKGVLQQYIDFYTFLLKYKDSCSIALFEDVINNYQQVIKQTNLKFKTNFEAKKISTDDETAILNTMKQINLRFKQGDESKSAFPSELKRQLKQDITLQLKNPEYQTLLNQAELIYQQYVT